VPLVVRDVVLFLLTIVVLSCLTLLPYSYHTLYCPIALKLHTVVRGIYCDC
jgi:hypothetical protein